MRNEASTPINPDLPITEIAYRLLKNAGQPQHYRDLFAEVLKIKGWENENAARLMAKIHTEVNMDARFWYKGNGVWGLREWGPRPTGTKVININSGGYRPRRGFRFPEDEENDLEDQDVVRGEEEEEPEDWDYDGI